MGNAPTRDIAAKATRSSSEAQHGDKRQRLRETLHNFYSEHNPENICNIASILSRFEGHHSMLEAELEKKYGAKLEHYAPPLLASDSRARDAVSRGSSVVYLASTAISEAVSKRKSQRTSERQSIKITSASGSLKSGVDNSRHKSYRQSSDSLTVHQSKSRHRNGTHEEPTALVKSATSSKTADTAALEEAARAEEVAELSRKVRLLKVRRHNLDVAKQIAIAKSALREGQLTKLRRDSAASSLRASADSSLAPSPSSSRCVSPALSSLAAHGEEDNAMKSKQLPATLAIEGGDALGMVHTHSLAPKPGHGDHARNELLYRGTSPSALIASPALEWPTADSPDRPNSPDAAAGMFDVSTKAAKNNTVGSAASQGPSPAPLSPGAFAEAKDPPLTPTRSAAAAATDGAGAGTTSGLPLTATPVALRPLEARLEAKKANLNKFAERVKQAKGSEEGLSRNPSRFASTAVADSNPASPDDVPMQAEAKDNHGSALRTTNTANEFAYSTNNSSSSSNSVGGSSSGIVKGSGPCQVSFDVTLLDQTAAMFGLRAQRKFGGACAQTLGLHADPVQVASVRAGSVVVATQVSGLADASAASAVAAAVVADSAKLSAGFSAVGLGRSTVSPSSPALELPDSAPAASTSVAPPPPPPRPARKFETQPTPHPSKTGEDSGSLPVEMDVEEDEARKSAEQGESSKEPVSANATAMNRDILVVQIPPHAQRNVRHHTLPDASSNALVANAAAGTDTEGEQQGKDSDPGNVSYSSLPVNRGPRGRVRASSLFDLVAKYENKSTSLPPPTSSSSHGHSRQQRNWSSSSNPSSLSTSAGGVSSSSSRRAPFLPRAVSLGSAAAGALVNSKSTASSSSPSSRIPKALQPSQESASRAMQAVSAVARLRLGSNKSGKHVPLSAVERLRRGIVGQQNKNTSQSNADQMKSSVVTAEAKTSIQPGAAAAAPTKKNMNIRSRSSDSTDSHAANPSDIPPSSASPAFKGDASNLSQNAASEGDSGASTRAEPSEPANPGSMEQGVEPAAAPAVAATTTSTAASDETTEQQLAAGAPTVAVSGGESVSRGLPLRTTAKRANSLSLAPRWATVAASSQTSSIRAKSLDRVAADTLYAEAQMQAAAAAAGSRNDDDVGAANMPAENTAGVTAGNSGARIPPLKEGSHGARGRFRFGSLRTPSSFSAAAAGSASSAGTPARSVSLSSVLVPARSAPTSLSPTAQPLSKSPSAGLATRSTKRSSLVASLAARFTGTSAPSPDRTPGNITGASSSSSATIKSSSSRSSNSGSKIGTMESTSSPSTSSSSSPDHRGMSLDRSASGGSSSSSANSSGNTNSLENNTSEVGSRSPSNKRALSSEGVLAQDSSSSGKVSKVQALRAKFSRSTPAAATAAAAATTTATTSTVATKAEGTGTASETAASASTPFGSSNLEGALFQPSLLSGAVAEDEEDTALVDDNDGSVVENARRVRLLSRARSLGQGARTSSDRGNTATETKADDGVGLTATAPSSASTATISDRRSLNKTFFPKVLTLTSNRSEENGGGAASFAGIYCLNEGAGHASTAVGGMAHGLPTWSMHKRDSSIVAADDADSQEFVIYSDHKGRWAVTLAERVPDNRNFRCTLPHSPATATSFTSEPPRLHLPHELPWGTLDGDVWEVCSLTRLTLEVGAAPTDHDALAGSRATPKAAAIDETAYSNAPGTEASNETSSEEAVSTPAVEQPSLEVAAAASTTRSVDPPVASQQLLTTPSLVAPGARPDGATPSSSMARSPSAAPLPEPFAANHGELSSHNRQELDLGSTKEKEAEMKTKKKDAVASKLELPQQAPGKEEEAVVNGIAAAGRKISPEAAAAKLSRAKASFSSYREGSAAKASAKRVAAGSGLSEAKRGAKTTSTASAAAALEEAQQKNRAATTRAVQKEEDKSDAKDAVVVEQATSLQAAAKVTPERKLTAKGAALAKKAAAEEEEEKESKAATIADGKGALTRAKAEEAVTSEAKTSPQVSLLPSSTFSPGADAPSPSIRPLAAVEASSANQDPPPPPMTAAFPAGDRSSSVVDGKPSAAAQLASATENTANALWLKLQKVVSKAGSEQSAMAALGMRAHVDGNDTVDPFEFEALLHRLGFMATADAEISTGSDDAATAAASSVAAASGSSPAADDASTQVARGEGTASTPTAALVNSSTDAAAAAVSAAVVAALLARVTKHTNCSGDTRERGDVSCRDLVRSLKDWDKASPWRKPTAPHQPSSSNHQQPQPQPQLEPMQSQASATATAIAALRANDDAASSGLAHSPPRGTSKAATDAVADGAVTSRYPVPAAVKAAATIAPGTPSLKAWRAQATGHVKARAAALQGASPVSPADPAALVSAAAAGVVFKGGHASTTDNKSNFAAAPVTAETAGRVAKPASEATTATAAAPVAAPTVEAAAKEMTVAAAAATPAMTSAGPPPLSDDESESPASVADLVGTFSVKAGTAAPVATLTDLVAAASNAPISMALPPPPLPRAPPPTPASPADGVNSDAAVTLRDIPIVPLPPLSAPTSSQAAASPQLPPHTLSPMDRSRTPESLEGSSQGNGGNTSNHHEVYGGGSSGWVSPSQRPSGTQAPRQAVLARAAAWGSNGSHSSSVISSRSASSAKSQAYSGADSGASASPPTPAEVDDDGDAGDEDETGGIPAARVLAFSPTNSAAKAPLDLKADDRALNDEDFQIMQNKPTSNGASASTAVYSREQRTQKVQGSPSWGSPLSPDDTRSPMSSIGGF